VPACNGFAVLENAEGHPKPDGAGGRWFQTTHWSVVLSAKDDSPSRAASSLEALCRAYWPPLYAFIRREGHAEADAQDLTQAFFTHLLERDFLGQLQDRRGKFRSFLLTFLKHFLADQRDRAAALKRGGGRTFVSFEEFTEERAHEPVASSTLTPEEAFERRWAQTVMDNALGQLRREYVQDGRRDLFEALADFQPGQHGLENYAEVGQRLGLSEGGVKTAVHRLRKRHREILREQIAGTVSSAGELDEEIRNLIAVLGR
jgi:RNA polymerase sigma factor (sigma-70 family)